MNILKRTLKWGLLTVIGLIAILYITDTDYLLKVVMPDMDYYQKFLLDKLNQIEGVSSIRTSFVLRQVVQRTEMPLDHI